MIISKIQGGLANQIFQWAYGKYLSVKYLTPLYLDISFYQTQFGVTRREFSLNKFPNISFNLLPHDKNISNWSNELTKTKLTKLNDNFDYFELKYQGDSHYYLDGYWQSEKYFIEIEDIIRQNLKPSELILKKLKSKYSIQNSVSIHVRRTDFLTSNGFHPVQPIEYYESALKLIDYDNILILSDDIEWCKNNLKFNNMVFVEGNDDIEDLWLMSLCNHNIISNSSFSWWGAWLNTYKDKKIISPRKWFGDSVRIDANKIIPEDWVKI